MHTDFSAHEIISSSRLISCFHGNAWRNLLCACPILWRNHEKSYSLQFSAVLSNSRLNSLPEIAEFRSICEKKWKSWGQHPPAWHPEAWEGWHLSTFWLEDGASGPASGCSCSWERVAWQMERESKEQSGAIMGKHNVNKCDVHFPIASAHSCRNFALAMRKVWIHTA